MWIAINVFSYNERAIKAYQKLGFMIEGTLREDLYFNGNYHDNILMGLLKRDYIESI
ncbi:GNAT family N-acetyltransferase [Fictibacillus sp. BK138]|uniref:GNAT family N-acetyltransferase n=1 Tax=Fictibacillus sp. BK138 TaxID=2512121 RepID=UPI00102A977E|nr:GNAT family protein [Fictibacillus sp. BK138]